MERVKATLHVPLVCSMQLNAWDGRLWQDLYNSVLDSMVGSGSVEKLLTKGSSHIGQRLKIFMVSTESNVGAEFGDQSLSALQGIDR